KRRELTRGETLALALAAGLGFLTKGTFFAYGPPLLAWFLLPKLLRGHRVRLLVDGGMVLVATVVLSLGLWTRNIATYGGPYGASDHLRRGVGIFQFLLPAEAPAAVVENPPEGTPEARNEIGTDKTPTAGAMATEGPETAPGGIDRPLGGGQWVRNLLADAGEALKLDLSMMGWNMVTPSSAVNALLRRVMGRLPWVYGEGYLILLQRLAWNHEDTAGNPLHLLLVPVTVMVLLLRRRRLISSVPFHYSITTLCAYAVLPIVATAGAGPWGIRYQLPFFVLWSALLGVGASAIGGGWIDRVSSSLLLIMAVPYVLLNNTRPLIGRPPWPTRIESIFTVSQEE
ncbi:MAG: hypothetical protein ACRDG5_00755, partial [Anaerolineales bacterium]